MKLKYHLFAAFILFLAIQLHAQSLKPYILGAKSTSTLYDTKLQVKKNLIAEGFEILGEYSPANDASRWLIAITSDQLKEAVSSVGNLAGFASAMRVGLTQEGNEILISYTDPIYWGNAYFRENFKDIEYLYTQIDGKLRQVMNRFNDPIIASYGSEKGIEPEDLHNYHYMMGMPRLDDTIILKEYDSFEEACAMIDVNLILGVSNVEEVYSVSVPSKNLKLYGLSLSGSTGEENFLSTIDINKPRHTAFLPYEFLVIGNEVHMLHGRYRIALSFPDLKMMTFTRIMSTPGDIKDLLKSVTEQRSDNY